MPRPASADIRCSTVATRTCPAAPESPAVSVEAMRVSLTRNASLRISTGGSRSTRRKTMPVLAAAGRSTSSTRSPECRPTPVVRTSERIVRCRIIGKWRKRKERASDALEHRLGARDLELAGRFHVERLDDAVLDQHRVALRTHTHAATGKVELETERLREFAA